MTTFNTGNPLGSADSRDLYDNAQSIDLAVNSNDLTFIDRNGVERLTLKGYEAAAASATLSENGSITNMITLTQSEYDALANPDETTLYIIIE